MTNEMLETTLPTTPPDQRPRLNILQVASCFPGWGGTEIHLLNLSQQLVARGHRVTITCRPGLFVEQEAQRRGLRTVPVTVIKQQDWRDRKPLGRLLREERFDVMHAHWRPDYVVTAALARRHGVPVRLLSHHSPHPVKPKEVFLYPRYLYTRMIALSESVRRMLLGVGMPPDFVTTIHHGTDTDAFRKTTLDPAAVRAAWNLPPNRFVVGIVGRIAQEKGILPLLEAIHLLTQSATADVPPLHLVIVGDGPQETEVREVIAARKLESHVTLAGFRSDVNNAINALDTLVLASTWEEPCAAVVQQAMILGKPVIGTNAGGTPEMVADGETGIIVPPNDASALAKAIQTITDLSPSEREAMGAKGAARVEALFSQRVMVDKIENLYFAEVALRSQTRQRSEIGQHAATGRSPGR